MLDLDRSSPTIVLTTLNAKYSHTSFGLRYLLANMGDLRERTRLREFTFHQPALEIVEQLLAENPHIIGFGIYIWNVVQTTEVLDLLRRLRPDIVLVIGGPEVSYEYEEQEAFRLCDHLIIGEADLAFRMLVESLLRGETPPKVIVPTLPVLSDIVLPYDAYTQEDLLQRLIYVEASRGCPFQCEFCLSSLDIPVRTFPLDRFLGALEDLLARGARAFKFVDRTFNLNLAFSTAILQFCLDHYTPGFELHFEMIPDRLPPAIREIVARFPPGAIQFEIGIQTLNPEVSRNISRPLKWDRIVENFRYLREHTGVHLHADLIFGLPGETLESFARGFDALLALEPGEIQLGILKRLRGTPIIHRTQAFALVFSSRPPYEVLQTSTVDFGVMQRMKRFARYFELYHNSGNFVSSLKLLFSPAGGEEVGDTVSQHAGSFWAFMAFSDWLFLRTGQTHQFALSRLFQLLFEYLVEKQGRSPELVAAVLLEDYDRHAVRRERLEFLRPYVPTVAAPFTPKPLPLSHGMKRTGKSVRTMEV